MQDQDLLDLLEILAEITAGLVANTQSIAALAHFQRSERMISTMKSNIETRYFQQGA